MDRSSTARLNRLKYRWKLKLAVLLGAAFFLWWLFALPDALFQDPTSSVLKDKQGKLLAARIAEDGQWRFPHNDSIPHKFKTCLIAFEDREFYNHFGFRVRSFLRAAKQNIEAGRVVSGASTLTMQTIRLARKGQLRTLTEKAVETLLATRLEWRYTKDEILAFYACNAPFGGNVVGLDAAAWRYFNRPADQLSWAESATLAILPNAPSLIFPGKNQQLLQKKRDRVLEYLLSVGTIDSITFHLALQEGLPGKPHTLPQKALPLLNFLESQHGRGKQFVTTLDGFLQKRVTDILNRYHQDLSANNIHNAAALVMEVKTGNVVSYCGNVENTSAKHGNLNDMIHTPRSTGSILKPFLYAAALEEGEITPKSLRADIPTNYGGYAPKNYNQSYAGAVPADQALARSLNVPAVRLLKDFGQEKFHHRLKQLGVSTLNHPASYYGLSIILGGSEGTLWDMVSIYRNLAMQVNAFPQDTLFHQPQVLKENNHSPTPVPAISTGAAYKMFEAMVNVVRPDNELMWRYFSEGKNIAWKTGTSFGFRDAWAVGVTPNYVVGVWVGNADGEGRPGLTGIDAAAPILFNVFDALPVTKWFEKPYDDLKEVQLCKKSGFISSRHCEESVTEWIPQSAKPSPPCSYCQRVFVDQSESHRVNLACEPNGKEVSWFVLTPIIEWYYKKKHPEYKRLPPYRADCKNDTKEFPMRLIYPKKQSEVYVPVDFDGNKEKVVFEASHRNEELTIYWHLDDEMVGITKEFHQLELNPDPGKHILTLIDELGNEFSQEIIVLEG